MSSREFNCISRGNALINVGINGTVLHPLND